MRRSPSRGGGKRSGVRRRAAGAASRETLRTVDAHADENGVGPRGALAPAASQPVRFCQKKEPSRPSRKRSRVCGAQCATNASAGALTRRAGRARGRGRVGRAERALVVELREDEERHAAQAVARRERLDELAQRGRLAVAAEEVRARLDAAARAHDTQSVRAWSRARLRALGLGRVAAARAPRPRSRCPRHASAAATRARPRRSAKGRLLSNRGR